MDDGLAPATSADRAGIASLLASVGLPVPKIDDAVALLLARDADGAVRGCVGVERSGDVAMLRSLAVRPDARRTGLAGRLIEGLCARLRVEGATEVFLLTTDQQRLFGRHGFAAIERAAVPAGLRASKLFSETHCATATAMARRL